MRGWVVLPRHRHTPLRMAHVHPPTRSMDGPRNTPPRATFLPPIPPAAACCASAGPTRPGPACMVRECPPPSSAAAPSGRRPSNERTHDRPYTRFQTPPPAMLSPIPGAVRTGASCQATPMGVVMRVRGGGHPAPIPPRKRKTPRPRPGRPCVHGLPPGGGAPVSCFQ